jgi:hypothetical protein
VADFSTHGEVILDLSGWSVTEIHCRLGDDVEEDSVTLRLRHNRTAEEQSLSLLGVTGESLFDTFPLLNAMLQLRDTSGRGWEAVRRIEVADADDKPVYLYARAWEVHK